MLTWTGPPGTKHPSHINISSTNEGIHIWIKNRFCEANFKIHSPVDEFNTKLISHKEWKLFASKIRADSKVLFKVKKQEIEVRIYDDGNGNATKFKVPCQGLESNPFLRIPDISGVGGPKKYIDSVAMGLLRNGLSTKTVAATLSPIIWSNDSIFILGPGFRHITKMSLGFSNPGCFSQGAVRIPLDSGGGTTIYAEDGNLMVSAIDFICKFPSYDGRNLSPETIKKFDGTFIPFGCFTNLPKKTHRASLAREISALTKSQGIIINGSLSFSSIIDEDKPGVIEMRGTDDTVEPILLRSADIVNAIRHMENTPIEVLSVLRNGQMVAACVVDSTGSNCVLMSGIKA